MSQLDWSAMNWSSINEAVGQTGPCTRMPGQALFNADMNQLDSAGELGVGEWPRSQ